MKNSSFISSMAIGSLAIAVAVHVPNADAASSQTAQSIMVGGNLNSGAFVIGGSTTWSYTHPVRTCASDHYTTVETGPTVTCDGAGCTTQPPTPPPPGDTPGHLNSFLNSSQAAKCAFFCGGTLPSDTNDRIVNVNIAHGTNQG